MSGLKPMLDQLINSDKYEEKGKALTILLNTFEQNKKPVASQDLADLKIYILAEVPKLIKLIPEVADYKLKDNILFYADKLVGFYMYLKSKNCGFDSEDAVTVATLESLVKKEQVLETSLKDIFKLGEIGKDDIIKVLDVVKSYKNEYQNGKFYYGLLFHKDKIEKMTGEARNEISWYICVDFEKFLNKKTLTEDDINSLEIATDVCKYFINDNIISLLNDILRLKRNNINYYVIDTLIFAGQKIDAAVVTELAEDLDYAELAHSLLKNNNMLDLFPKQFTNPEYLAKSDMVHWLTYPTELGQVPDEIEFLGSTKAGGELYYVFKFKSYSDTLDDDLKNEWLIGWSSDEGGTFSNFDKLSLFEQKNPEKTLKFIKKKLLG